MLQGCMQQAPAQGQQLSVATLGANANSTHISVLVIINDGINTTERLVSTERGTSALDVFAKATEISYKKYPFGSYVYSVGGLPENKEGNHKYWQYYVDGRIAMIAVDNYKIESDVSLEFRYETPNHEIK